MTTGAAPGRVDAAFTPLLLTVTITTFAVAVQYRYGFGLTVDEPFMANTARLPWNQLWALLPIDNLPFGYVMLRWWSALFGESEIALRALSSTAYAIAVFCTGMAVRRISGVAAGLGAAILLASSDRIGLEYAATARPYALLACLSAAALWQTLALVDASTARTSRLVGVFATHLLGLFTHPTYVVVAVALSVAAAMIDTPRRRALVALPAAAVATYLVVWLPQLQATIALGTTRWMRPPTLADVRAAVELMWGWRPAVVMATALGITLCWRAAGRCRPNGDRARLVIAGAAIAWVVAIGGSYVKPIFEASRTPMLLLPLTCTALAVVLESCGRAAVVIGCALVCLTAATVRMAARPGTDPAPSRQVLADVLTRAQCGDVVIAPGVTATTVEYYFRRLHAPPCIPLMAFPADLYDVFADWKGRLQNADTRNRLQREADATAHTAAQQHAIWLLGLTSWETREASTMIDAAVERVAVCEPPVAARGAFIDSVRRCTPKPQPRKM
jgi:uncharacterized membrane protein